MIRSESVLREIAGIRQDQRRRRKGGRSRSMPTWALDHAIREAAIRTENDPQGHAFAVVPASHRGILAYLAEYDRDGTFVGFL